MRIGDQTDHYVSNGCRDAFPKCRACNTNGGHFQVLDNGVPKSRVTDYWGLLSVFNHATDSIEFQREA